jgi:hypothetical protein
MDYLTQRQNFQVNEIKLLHFSTLKLKPVSSSKMLVLSHQTTLYHIQEEANFQCRQFGNVITGTWNQEDKTIASNNAVLKGQQT